MRSDSLSQRLTIRWFGSLVAFLLLVGLVAVPSHASAVTSQKQAVSVAPVKFEPGRINRTPVGGPIPASAGKGPKILDPASSDGLEEVVERRTENSKTSSTEDGHMVTEFFQQPVNFKDLDGKWQPIDNRLVVNESGNAPVRNRANEINISLPRDLAAGPARVESKGQFVEFSPKGAALTPGVEAVPAEPKVQPPTEPAPSVPAEDGAETGVVPEGIAASPEPTLTPTSPEPTSTPPSSPTPAPTPSPTPAAPVAPERRLEAPSSSAVRIKDETATYSGAYKGVDAVYTSMTQGLKEELILAGPDAPLTFEFVVKMSSGLKAEPTPAGGIAFVKKTGEVWGQFSAPFAHDATFPGSDPGQGVTSDVKLEIVPDADQLVVRLSLSEPWAKDPSRKFPLTIDPSLLTGSSDYTMVTSAAADAVLDNYPYTAVYGAPTPYRVLGKPIPDMANFFKEPVDITAASMFLNTMYDSTGQAAKPVGAYEITSEWAATQATWNNRKTGVAWGVAGGDTAAQPETVLANITGPVGSRKWSILSMVRAWVSGDRPYNGAMVRYVNEAEAAPPIFFNPANAAFSISWLPKLGLHDPYTFQSFGIGEGQQAMVNVVSGSLKLTGSDVGISGIAGLDATISRSYDSRVMLKTSFGLNWMMWPGGRERVYETVNGELWWVGGPQQSLLFTDRRPNPNGDGTHLYTSPQGYRGSAVRMTDGAVVVTLHDSGMQYGFAAGGYVAWVADRNGNQITYNYTYNAGLAEWLLTSMSDTRGRVTTFTRAAGSGYVTKVTDPAGRESLYGYTADAATPSLASYTDPAGKITRYEYLQPGTGNLSPLTKITDPNGNQTRFTYVSAMDAHAAHNTGTPIIDLSHRLTSVVRVTDAMAGTGPTWTFDYSVAGKTKVTSPNPKETAPTVYTHDKLGRVTEVLDALGKTVSKSYWPDGFVKDQTDQAGKTTTSTYAAGNLMSVDFPSTMTQSSEFLNTSHPHYPTKGTNAQGRSVSLTYDTPGNLDLQQNQLAINNEVDPEYNPNGTILSTKDGMDNLTTFDYFPNWDLQKINAPLGVDSKTFTYDTLSRVKTVTDAKNQTTTFTYDALDRVTKTEFSGGSYVVNVFDDGGRLTSRADHTGPGLLDPVNITTYTYDALNRQKTKTAGGATFTSTYDGVGNLLSMTDPSGTVSYDYDAVNRLNWVKEPGTGAPQTSYGYDLAYRPNLITYPNGVTQATVYDDDGKATSIVGKKADGTVLTSLGYDYNNPDLPAGGQQTSLVFKLTEPAGITSYKYDEVDRLKEAIGPTGSFLYSYDGNSNRTTQTVNGTITHYAVNAADQLCHHAATQAACGSAPAGATTFSYDLNGNLTGQSDGRVLTYNPKDQNTSYTPGGLLPPTSTMGYLNEGQAERTSAAGSTFTNSPLGLASSSAGLLSPTTFYVRDPGGGLIGQRTGTVAHYYLFDRLGSVVALTDAGGNAVNRYAYDPYGNRLAGTVEAVANPWQFAGGFRDAFSGYVKFGERYYDPSIGRWTQRDPSGQDANSYLYAGGNPVNYIDGTGLAWWNAVGTFAGIASSALRYMFFMGCVPCGTLAVLLGVASLVPAVVAVYRDCYGGKRNAGNCKTRVSQLVISGAALAGGYGISKSALSKLAPSITSSFEFGVGAVEVVTNTTLDQATT